MPWHLHNFAPYEKFLDPPMVVGIREVIDTVLKKKASLSYLCHDSGADEFCAEGNNRCWLIS